MVNSVSSTNGHFPYMVAPIQVFFLAKVCHSLNLMILLQSNVVLEFSISEVLVIGGGASSVEGRIKKIHMVMTERNRISD